MPAFLLGVGEQEFLQLVFQRLHLLAAGFQKLIELGALLIDPAVELEDFGDETGGVLSTLSFIFFSFAKFHKT